MELLTNYRNISGFKVNTQKSITFLYNSSKQMEF